MENKDKPAFPISGDQLSENDELFNSDFGLTKREHFAAMAMQGLLAANSPCLHGNVEMPVASEIANWSVLMADALLIKLEQ